MRAALDRAWASRAPRERAILIALGLVLCAALYAWLVLAAIPARAQLRESVASLRVQAVRLDLQAQEYLRLRAAPAATSSPADLRSLIRTRAGEAGLSGALVRIDAADADRVKVEFGALQFSDWLAWVASLQAQQIRLESCRIEALAAPGMVSVVATFARSGL